MGGASNNSTFGKNIYHLAEHMWISFYFIVTAPGWAADVVHVRDTSSHESCNVWSISTRSYMAAVSEEARSYDEQVALPRNS